MAEIMEHEVTIKKELITPQIAEEYLRRNIHNRPIKNGLVRHYADQMKQGNWRCAAVAAITFDWNDDLQDGQHRLKAIVKSGCNIWMYVKRGANPEDFIIADTGKVRGVNDTLALCGIPNYKNISAIIRAYFTLQNNRSALYSHGNLSANSASIGLKAPTNADYKNTYYQYENLWKETNSFVSAIYRQSKLLPAGFSGGLYAYLIQEKNNDVSTVKNFFLEFAGSSKNNTIVLLRNKLIDDMMKPKEKRMYPFYKQKLIAKAWNAYRKGKELKTLYVQPNEDIDFD